MTDCIGRKSCCTMVVSFQKIQSFSSETRTNWNVTLRGRRTSSSYTCFRSRLRTENRISSGGLYSNSFDCKNFRPHVVFQSLLLVTVAPLELLQMLYDYLLNLIKGKKIAWWPWRWRKMHRAWPVTSILKNDCFTELVPMQWMPSANRTLTGVCAVKLAPSTEKEVTLQLKHLIAIHTPNVVQMVFSLRSWPKFWLDRSSKGNLNIEGRQTRTLQIPRAICTTRV